MMVMTAREVTAVLTLNTPVDGVTLAGGNQSVAHTEEGKSQGCLSRRECFAKAWVSVARRRRAFSFTNIAFWVDLVCVKTWARLRPERVKKHGKRLLAELGSREYAIPPLPLGGGRLTGGEKNM